MKSKKITQEELDVFLRKHKLWLEDDPAGERANLSGTNLSGTNLSGADLSEADLSEATMRGADLSGATLRDADLNGATLRGADLRGADLSGATLRGADLRGADLSGADLSGADLREANLSGANLDYSVLPLWCGSLGAHFDDKQLAQIAYHLVKAGLCSKNASDDTKTELAKLVDFANRFHKVYECGRIEVNDD